MDKETRYRSQVTKALDAIIEDYDLARVPANAIKETANWFCVSIIDLEQAILSEVKHLSK